MQRDLGQIASWRHQRLVDEAARAAAKGNRGDLFDTGQHDQHQRHHHQDAQAKRNGGTGNEVMTFPISGNAREPCARHMRGSGQECGLAGGRAAHGKNGQ